MNTLYKWKVIAMSNNSFISIIKLIIYLTTLCLIFMVVYSLFALFKNSNYKNKYKNSTEICISYNTK